MRTVCTGRRLELIYALFSLQNIHILRTYNSELFGPYSACLFVPQSNDCQASDWPYHKTKCTPVSPPQSRVPPDKVWGITIACDADRARGAQGFEAKLIDSSHPIHTQGIPCPLFQQVGFPLILFRHIADDPASMQRDLGLDNQVAAHLLTHPNTGHPDEK